MEMRASAASSKISSDVRRLRAARLNVQVPSFSLGIDTESFRYSPPCDLFPETNSSRHGEEEKRREAVEQIVVQSDRVEGFPETNSSRHGEEEKRREAVEQIVVQSDRFEGLPEANSSRHGEEAKSFKVGEQIVVPSDSDDDLETIGSQQQRRLKRLKRGPSSAGKAPLSRAPDLSISARRRSNDMSECITQLYKEPLPSAKNSTNKVPEDGRVAGIQSVDYVQERFQTVGRNSHKRSEPESSLASGEDSQCSRDFLSRDVPKFGSRREGGSTAGIFSLNRNRIPSVYNVRNNTSEGLHASSNGDVDEDDIEEFSDDELFGSGSRTQRDRRSLRPQMSVPSLILLSSSPETSQKQKAVLQIPGVDIPRKVPLKASQPPTADPSICEEDTVLIDDFEPESGWTQTRPDFSRPAQTPQQLPKSTSDNHRAYCFPTSYQTSQQDLFKDTNRNTFETETPARRDIVGPSEGFRNDAVNQTEKDRIQAFFRQRFPHYKPVDALLVDGGLDNEPVYIDYRKQFAEGSGSTQLQSGNASTTPNARYPAVRSINEALSAYPPSVPTWRRKGGNKKAKSKGQPRGPYPRKTSTSVEKRSRSGKGAPGGSEEGNWRTVNGTKVYIVAGEKLTGQHAYRASKKHAWSGKKKNKKRPSTKSK